LHTGRGGVLDVGHRSDCAEKGRTDRGSEQWGERRWEVEIKKGDNTAKGGRVAMNFCEPS